MQQDQELKMYSDFKSPYAFLAFDPVHFALEDKYRIKAQVETVPAAAHAGKGESAANTRNTR